MRAQRSDIDFLTHKYAISIQQLIRNTITAQTFQLPLRFRLGFDNSLNNRVPKGTAARCAISKPAFAEFPCLFHLEPAGDLPDEE